MASDSIYTCTECGANLNLSASYLYPPDFFFEAGNKETLSFSWVDSTKFRFEKEDKIRPFFRNQKLLGHPEDQDQDQVQRLRAARRAYLR
ncbi:hypothetical protein GBA52_023199 [Prunus armeniaca]|nr:hypothetical protein GBA52_023199 [Prunus armeniaca]